jgi:hypothetical protein
MSKIKPKKEILQVYNETKQKVEQELYDTMVDEINKSFEKEFAEGKDCISIALDTSMRHKIFMTTIVKELVNEDYFVVGHTKDNKLMELRGTGEEWENQGINSASIHLLKKNIEEETNVIMKFFNSLF